MKSPRRRKPEVFEVLIFDMAGQSEWQVNSSERQDIRGMVHEEFMGIVQQYNGLYRGREGDNGRAYFKIDPARSYGFEAGREFLNRRDSIQVKASRVSKRIKISYRILLTRAEIVLGNNAGDDSSSELDFIMKKENEKRFAAPDRFRVMDRAFDQLPAAVRNEMSLKPVKWKDRNAYQYKKTRVAGKKSENRIEILEAENRYLKFFAFMTNKNLAARNTITSHFIRRVEMAPGHVRSNPLKFLRQIFDSRKAISAILNAVHMFFNRSFSDANFYVTFWTPAGKNHLRVFDYKYPKGRVSGSYKRNLKVRVDESAVGYAFLRNEVIVLSNIVSNPGPFRFFYPQQPRKNIRSIACFPIQSLSSRECHGVLCVGANKTGLFETESRDIYRGHISSYVLNLDLACQLMKKGV